jgi:hypothetical protein
MGISVGDAARRCAWPSPASKWATGSTRPAKPATWRCACAGRPRGTENIERLPIAVTGTNMMVPLDQIAKITMGKGPSAIEHKDGKRVITVSANVQGRSNGEVTPTP